MNAIEFILKEITDSTALYNDDKDGAQEKLDTIEHNVLTATFLSVSDRERMQKAISMARSLMINGLIQNALDDIKVSIYKTNRVREFAKKCEWYNRELHIKTQEMLLIIDGLRRAV